MRALRLAFLFLVLGCGSGESTSESTGAKTAAGLPKAEVPAPPEGLTPGEAADRFDTDRCFGFVERQLAFGPRVPGSSAHEACGDWMVETLTAAGGTVVEDRFTVTDPRGTVRPLRNILGRFGPEGNGRLLLVAHWDSRPWADRDPDPAKREDPVPGANDGASGVAVLLEIAQHLASARLERGVDLLLVDGEDLGQEGAPTTYALGSQHFAAKGVAAYDRGVVLDMVGDVDLRIPVEVNSLLRAPEVVDWIWARAEQLGSAPFVREPGQDVYDDHIPLLDAGLPTVDLIDLDYVHWHTVADDLRGVSAGSLASVGRVMLSLVLVP